MATLRRSRAGRIALAILGLLAFGTVVAIAILWPSGEQGDTGISGLASNSRDGEVTAVSESACPGSAGDVVCRSVEVRLEENGNDAGGVVTVQLGAGGLDPDVSIGDGVQVAENPVAPGVPATYSLTDFQRGTPILLLAAVFALLVVSFGRMRGALSLVGLLGSLLVVLLYVVPAIRDGQPALAVALSGSMAVMLVTIALAHGLGVKSIAAMLGTAASLGLVVVLASLFTEWAHLTGFSSEEASYLASSGSSVSVQGLLLAGMVIGALGVLDDVTISQSSTVMALRAANPELSIRELYRRAIEVGRDHVSATVNTLVLAYVGASLPILLIFSSGSIGLFEAINVELVAKEVVATLVGSIGLIAAVPLTTILAAVLAAGLPGEALERESAGAHSH